MASYNYMGFVLTRCRVSGASLNNAAKYVSGRVCPTGGSYVRISKGGKRVDTALTLKSAKERIKKWNSAQPQTA